MDKKWLVARFSRKRSHQNGIISDICKLARRVKNCKNTIGISIEKKAGSKNASNQLKILFHEKSYGEGKRI